MEFTAPHPQSVSSPSLPGPRIRGHLSSAHRTLASATAAVALLGVGLYAGLQLGGPSATRVTANVGANAPLSARVLDPSTLPGFMLSTDAAPVRSASEWAAVERAQAPSREAARLRAIGFVGGFDEQLHGRSAVSAEAVSVVERYQTTSGARQELADRSAQLLSQPGSKVSTFAVPAIPGARGVRVEGRGNAGLNILFASGPYFYSVGAGFPSASHVAVSQAQLSAAAGTLYLTTTGCVAGSNSNA
jgi:hypothetical protein